MPRVACASCAKAYEVSEQSLGGRAQCKSCGETFTLCVSRDETFSQGQPAGSGAAPLNAPVHAESGLVAGNQLGQYILKKQLGAGGMGEVWLARDPHLERDVALKVLPVAIAHDDQRRERFAREARLAARLHHPNAVIVYQFGLEEQQVFIAMELVDGQSLDKIVQENGPLDWRDATRVICDAARGLAAAHEIGLVHRDIKPANLMRTSKGETKVVDFGLAREQFADTQFTQEGMTLGTPAYMAPEQWANENVDGRTDLYSLICTYYYLLSGALPFEATNFAALGYQHRYEPLPDPRQRCPNLPDRVIHILARGAAKEPGDRYQTAAELIADLEALLAAPDAPVIATAAPAPPNKSMPPRPYKKALDVIAHARARWFGIQPRKRRIIATCSAAALLLLLGIIILVPTPKGTVKIEIDDPQAIVVVDQEKIAVEQLGEPIELRTGEHELIVRRGDVVVETRDFTIVKGEKTVVKITLLEDDVVSAADAQPTVQKAAPEPAQATNAPQPVPATNEPPVLAALSDRTVIIGDELTMRVQASDPDDEDAALRYSLLRQPIGATINPTTGEFRWRPTDTQAGQQYQLTVQVEDDGTPPCRNEQSFLVTVTHRKVAGEERDDNSLKMKFCWIPAGQFVMGSPESEEGRSDNERQVQVTLTRGFWFGTQEVTQREWRTMIGTEPWKGVFYSREGDRYPATWVTWHDANKFCRKLTDQERRAGRLGQNEEYRLPTEAEWEYACRAGTDTAYSFGNNASQLSDYAWWGGFSDGTVDKERGVREVGVKRVNPWGLHDMHGNVVEWCQDVYVEELPGGSDPVVSDGMADRVVRGGAWNNDSHVCRSAWRYKASVEKRMWYIGFRIVRSSVK